MYAKIYIQRTTNLLEAEMLISETTINTAFSNKDIPNKFPFGIDESVHIVLDVEKIQLFVNEFSPNNFDGNYWLIVGMKPAGTDIFTKEHLIIEKIYHNYPIHLGKHCFSVVSFIFVFLDIKSNPFPFIPMMFLLITIFISYSRFFLTYHFRIFAIK